MRVGLVLVVLCAAVAVAFVLWVVVPWPLTEGRAFLKRLGVVVFLVCGTKARADVKVAIRSLVDFNPHAYDIAVFSDNLTALPDEISSHVPQMNARGRGGRRVTYHDVSSLWGREPNFAQGQNRSLALLKRQDACARERSIAYHHQAYSWTVHIFRTRLMQEYDFVMKHDADMRLIAAVPSGLFEKMQKEAKLFAYFHRCDNCEQPKCHQGVMEFVRSFARLHRLPVESLSRVGQRTIYFGFTFVMATSFATSPAWKRAVDAVEASRGVYEKRWDGQDLFPGLMALLMARSILWCATSLRLYHQGEPQPRE